MCKYGNYEIKETMEFNTLDYEIICTLEQICNIIEFCKSSEIYKTNFLLQFKFSRDSLFVSSKYKKNYHTTQFYSTTFFEEYLQFNFRSEKFDDILKYHENLKKLRREEEESIFRPMLRISALSKTVLEFKVYGKRHQNIQKRIWKMEIIENEHIAANKIKRVFKKFMERPFYPNGKCGFYARTSWENCKNLVEDFV